MQADITETTWGVWRPLAPEGEHAHVSPGATLARVFDDRAWEVLSSARAPYRELRVLAVGGALSPFPLPELLVLHGLGHPVIARSRETGEVSPELRELVARGLRAWLKRSLRARIQTGYVRQRMAALGMEPAARPCMVADPVELVLIVNGWVMRAAMAELRVAGGASPRSMVGRAILEHLRGQRLDFEEVYRKTLGWQQVVAGAAVRDQEFQRTMDPSNITDTIVHLSPFGASVSWQSSEPRQLHAVKTDHG